MLSRARKNTCTLIKRDLKGNENIEDVKTIFQNFGWKIINDETNAGADFYIGEDSVIGYVVYFNHNDISILREKKNQVKKILNINPELSIFFSSIV